jgi:hypothetical protein
VPAAVVLPLLLCPLYSRGGGAAAPSDAERFSLDALPDASPRFWAPVAAAYALVTALTALLAREQRALLRLRLAAAAATRPSPEELAILVVDVPLSHAKAVDVQAYFGSMYPGMGPFPLVAMAPVVGRVEAAWRERNAAAADAHAARAALPQHLLAGGGGGGGGDEESMDGEGGMVDEAAAWEAMAAATRAGAALDAAEASLRLERAAATRGPSCAAFVLFPTRAAAAAAAATLHSAHTGGGSWHACPAPHPSAVLWSSLQLRPLARFARTAATTAAGAAVVLSFLFVVAGVASLVSVASTQAALPARIVKLAPLLSGYGAVAALLACLYGAPLALQALSAASGHVSVADADADASSAFFWLYVVDVFLGSAAIQALMRQLGGSLHRGSGFSVASVGDAVGGSVPGAAPFFIAFALTRAGTSLAAQLTRATDAPALLARLAAARTARAERAAWAPTAPPFVDWVPSALFLLLLGLVYAPLAPLIAPPVAAAFAGGAVVFRYQLLYVYAPSRGGRGRLWLHLRDGAAQAALVAVGTLAAVLAWRRAAAPAVALVPLFAFVAAAWRAARADDGGMAFSRLPRDVAAAADAAHGPLTLPLPFPFPEAFYPACMYDDVALQPDAPRRQEHADAYAAAVRRSMQHQHQHRGGERAPVLPSAGAGYGATSRAPPPQQQRPPPPPPPPPPPQAPPRAPPRPGYHAGQHPAAVAMYAASELDSATPSRGASSAASGDADSVAAAPPTTVARGGRGARWGRR